MNAPTSARYQRVIRAAILVVGLFVGWFVFRAIWGEINGLLDAGRRQTAATRDGERLDRIIRAASIGVVEREELVRAVISGRITPREAVAGFHRSRDHDQTFQRALAVFHRGMPVDFAVRQHFLRALEEQVPDLETFVRLREQLGAQIVLGEEYHPPEDCWNAHAGVEKLR